MNRWRQVLENVREQGGQVDEQNDDVWRRGIVSTAGQQRASRTLRG